MSKEEFNIIDSILDDIEGNSGDKQVIEIRDAQTEIAKVLVPQWGSDPNFISEGRIDNRRFTNLTEIDAIWMSWFSLLPKEYGGIWASDFADEMRNHLYSVGAQHKKLLIGFQQAVSGDKKKEGKTDNRTFIEKHLTRRNQKVEDELYDV